MLIMNHTITAGFLQEISLETYLTQFPYYAKYYQYVKIVEKILIGDFSPINRYKERRYYEITGSTLVALSLSTSSVTALRRGR